MGILQKNEIEEILNKHNSWNYLEDKKSFARKAEFKGYYKTISFVNALSFYANQKIHHPDLYVTYNSCEILFTTHDLGGVSQKDVEMMEIVDKLLD